MITTRSYTAEDRPALVQLMHELQDYLASIDPINRVRAIKDFDVEKYVEHLLQTIEHEQGVVFVAKEQESLLGFVAGSVPQEDDEDILDHYPSREGKIHELVVSAKQRGQGTGRLLMERIEEYFKEQGCEYVRVGCFAPNTAAHAFYEKCGYADRYTEMLKKFS